MVPGRPGDHLFPSLHLPAGGRYRRADSLEAHSAHRIRYIGCRRPVLRVDVALRRGPLHLPGGLMQTRFPVVFASLLLLPALAAADTSSRGVVLQPDKLVILSTTEI